MCHKPAPPPDPPITAEQFYRWKFLLNVTLDECQTCVGHIQRLEEKDSATLIFNAASIGDRLWQMNTFVLITQLAKVYARPKQWSQQISLAKLFIALQDPINERLLIKCIGLQLDPLPYWKTIADVHSFVDRSRNELTKHDVLIKAITEVRDNITAHTRGTYKQPGNVIPPPPTLPDFASLKELTDTGVRIFRELCNGMGTPKLPTNQPPTKLNEIIKLFGGDPVPPEPGDDIIE